MLPLFTKYLIQFKRVCIPGIGTFEIVQQSPQLGIAEKLFFPPFFIARHREQGSLTRHQCDFFASSDGLARKNIEDFGEKLRSRIQAEPFKWNGFGILRYETNGIVFESDQINLSSLVPVPAQKVKRQNAQHSMLVGDQQMTSSEVTQVLHQTSYKRPVFMIIGWAAFILALIAIVILLYLSRFQVSAAGMR